MFFVMTSPESVPRNHALPAADAARSTAGALRTRPAVVALALSGLGVLTVLATSGAYRAVTAPIVAILVVASVFYVTLFRRSAILPVDEIGTWYMAVLAAYMTIPLVIFLVLGLQYTPLNDLRLFLAEPSATEVGRVGWYYAAYAAAFAAVYLAVRGHRPAVHDVPHVPGASALTAGVGIAAALGVSVAVGQAFDMRAESYADAYRVVQQLPLAVRQLLRLSIGLKLVFGLVLLTWAFADFRHRRWLIAGWFTLELADTLVAGGARTDLMLFIVSAAILYHRAVRPLRFRTAALGGALLLTAFLALGILRAYRQLTDPAGFATGISGGEFETLFSNALDMLRRREAGELAAHRWAVWGADFRAIVPSQLLPVPKTTYAEWYVSTFYPAAAEAGHGYAFGAIPQSALGFGLPEVFVRGGVLGALFAAADRILGRRTRKLWPTVAYLWLTLWAYQSFRASTFYVLSMLVQQFVPAVAIVAIGRAFLVGALGAAAPRRESVGGVA
jgi:hypothetical protein